MENVDLVSLLQKALLQHHVYLDPVATPAKRAKLTYDPNESTLRYVASLLEENVEEDEEDRIMQNSHKSFNNLITELSELVSSPSSESSAEDSPPPLPPEPSESTTVEELQSMLLDCGQAVAANEKSSVFRMVDLIQQKAAGSNFEKVTFMFVEALVARLKGWAMDPLKAVPVKDYCEVVSRVPCTRAGHLFAAEMILEKCTAAKRVHIVDYGIDRGYQWACLIDAFAKRPEGPPYLKITGVEFSRLHRPETGPKLVQYAKSKGVHLLYESIVSDSWETANPSCGVDQDEFLVVNSNMRLKHLPEDGITMANPRRLFLDKIHRMRPALFLQCEASVNLSGPFFFPRFQEAVRYFYPAWEFAASYLPDDDMKATMGKIHARKIMNIVACEGQNRYERPTSHDNWHHRVRRAGFKQAPLSDSIFGKVEALLGGFQRTNSLGLAQDREWLLVGWKNVVLYALCGWQPT